MSLSLGLDPSSSEEILNRDSTNALKSREHLDRASTLPKGGTLSNSSDGKGAWSILKKGVKREKGDRKR